MRFLLDENADVRIAAYLHHLGHDVTTILHSAVAGASDEHVLALARSEHRILITNDRDFGELVFRHRHAHSGVILFRLRDVGLQAKLAGLERVLSQHAEELNQFIVVTDRDVRIRPHA